MVRDKIKIKDFFLIILLAVVYFISAKLGFSLALVHSNITAVWPPTGLSLALMLIFGIRLWPGVFIGAFFANITTEGTILTSIFIALGNTLEAVVGVYAINIFAKGRRAFESLQNTLKFLFFGGILSPIISSTIGVSTLFLAGFSESSSYLSAWLTWWLGDASSAILIAPLLILWANDRSLGFNRRQIIEIIIIFLTLGTLVRAVFGGLIFEYNFFEHNYPLEFLVIPILAWISIRFTPRGMMTSIIIIAVISAWGTLNGNGPFIGPWSANNSLIFLQSFLITIAATSLALAVTVWERKKVEMALQKADQVKDEFLTTLSHELRNPLASVFGYLQLIQLGSARYSKKKKAIENIESDLRHVTSLLDDLLDLSRVRRGKIKLQKEFFEVNSLIKEVVSNIKPMIEEQRQTLNIKKISETLWINADIKRVKQVLVNLLSNAVKYTEPGGHIWISSFKSGHNACIEVRDTGKGLTNEMISKIFDMFSQAGRPATRTEKGFRGLGIGLTVVKKFVELHGGSVSVESEGLGKGSKFTVSFPMTEKPIEEINNEMNIENKKSTIEKAGREAKEIEKIKNRSRKLHIMVVDDNERAANSLLELLIHFGHEVTVSYTGVEALRDAQRLKPEVVILDIGLPDIDGYEVGQELRKRYRKIDRELLLIALSGYGQVEDIKHSEEAGFNYHLVKPIDIITLQKILIENN